MRLSNQFERLPQWLVYLLAYSVFVLVAYGDYVSGPRFSMALFYLVPVYFLTWYAGIIPGITMVCLAMISMIGADLGWAGIPTQSALFDWDRFARFCFILISTIQLGRLRERYHKEQSRSRRDFLTGLANRREFFTVAEQERQRMARYERPLSLAYVDLDGFKLVNDSLGHRAGDMVLVKVAQTLRNNVRSTDLVARMGGDEFLVLFPETGPHAALNAMQKLRDLLLELSRDNRWPVTYSVGLVTFEAPPETTDEMIAQADRLMYLVKKKSKNDLAAAIWPGRPSKVAS